MSAMSRRKPVDPAIYRKERTHPLIRFHNGLGALSRDREFPWTSLDEEVLIRRARRIARWDDFGMEDFREPLRRMLRAGREEGHLTYTGRCLLSAGMLNALCTRLRIRREIHAHAEILEQPVKRPLIIVGAPRTGTTLLNRLLSMDPAGRPLLGWESLRPAPIKPGRRRGAVQRSLLLKMAVNERIVKWLMPDLSRMHPYAWNQPDECHWLLLPSFVFPAAMVLPQYHAWMLEQPDSVYEQAYGDYRMALRILEWQRPAQSHWILKSPLHLWALGAAAKVVPEASFIQTHRSLHDVLPSFCSVAAALMDILSDAVEPQAMGPHAMQFARETIERFTLARRTFDRGRILDLRYADLIADPAATVRKVYDTFGYEYTPEYDRRLKAYLGDSQRPRPANHEYSLEQFGLDGGEITREFDAYHREYGLA